MKKILAISFSLIFVSFTQAQINFDSFLEAGEDANKLLEGYMEPAFVGMGYGLNSGWYNTGKPHKLLGFDITVEANAAMIPTDAEFFKFDNADYTKVQLANGTSADLPTLFGQNLDADDIPELEFNQGTPESLRVTAPTGMGLKEAFSYNMIPVPAAQIGIGLIKNTEVKLRLVPEQNIDGNSISLFGIGVMHDIKQWIPGLSALPIDLSGFFGYSKLTTNIDMDEGNTAELNISGTTFQVIASKKIAVLTAYAGLGLITTSSDFGLKGTYDIEGGTLTDPIDLSYKSSGPRLNVGARLKLLILTFHAEYALQKYNTFTAGVGISIR